MAPPKQLKTPLSSQHASAAANNTTDQASISSPQDPNITQILAELQNSSSNDDAKPAAKRQKFISLSPDQFERLLQTCTKQQETISRLTSESPNGIIDNRPQRHPTQPAYYSNAKYEEISCRAIKPSYDGSEEHLIPFLTRLDLRRQNEGWAPATYITINDTQYDLTCHFACVDETDITTIAKTRWTSTSIDHDKHTVGHITYQSRLLAMVILNSITDDFMTVLIHRVPQSLRNDGTFLLWSLCHNIHRNNVAFTEKIREKITTATLTNFNNDVLKYIIHIKDNLKMITTTSTSNPEHNGLITYILRQLKLSPVRLFHDYVRKLHVEYQEGKHPNMTPHSLLTIIENKIRVLKHADEWHEDNANQPGAMALAASASKQPTSLEETLLKQIQTLTQIIERNNTRQPGKGKPYSEWKHSPPTNLSDIKTYNGKTFRWCTKCNNGKGQWASAHDTTTHVDGYKHDRSKTNNGRSQQNGILKNGTTPGERPQPRIPRSNVSFVDLHDNMDPQNHNANTAQLSLSDGIDNCWRFDISDATEN